MFERKNPENISLIYNSEQINITARNILKNQNIHSLLKSMQVNFLIKYIHKIAGLCLTLKHMGK